MSLSRRRHHYSLQDPTNHESDGEFLWLISLSDLMILLFVFFVVLFSFSYKRLQAVDFAKINEAFSGKAAQMGSLDEIQKRLLKWVISRNLLDSFQVEIKEDALILSIREKALFPSGSFELTDSSQDWISQLGAALEEIPGHYRIGIEGHTDDMPLNHQAHATDNWDLSVKRAHTVLMALKLGEERLKQVSLMGYAHMKPVVPNRDEQGRPLAQNQALNRRVSIRVY